MYFLDNVRLATRTFKTRKLRTFLTILGIGVGIGAILFLVSLGYGMQRVLLERITRLDALLSLDVTTTDPDTIQLNEDLVSELNSIESVVEVSPLRNITSNAKIGEISSQVNFSAVNDSYLRLGGVELLFGESFDEENKKNIILSKGALTSFGIENPEEALGKSVDITFTISKQNTNQEGVKQDDLLEESQMVDLEQDFIISGVVDDESNSFGYIHIEWTEGLNLSNYDGLKVKVEDQSYLSGVRNMLIEKGLSVITLSETIDQANKIFATIQFILALFGLVALSVSAIGMFNTMTIALLERTNEIGIMKSIGASNRDVKIMFLVESLLIGFFGGVGGVILGIGGAEFVNFMFNMLAKNMGGQTIDLFSTPIWFILFIVTFSLIVGIFTGIYPARRAAKLNPLMALRYK